MCKSIASAALIVVAGVVVRADPPVPRVDAIVEAARELPRLHSLLVSHRGTLVVERYFNGARATRLANIKSASKSVISALVGIAIDRKLIKGIDQPIADFFPDVFRLPPSPLTRLRRPGKAEATRPAEAGRYAGGVGATPEAAIEMKRRITIEDLLTMRSGLDSTSGRNYGAWVRSPNWVRHALNRPLLTPPGTEMDYSTGNSHLLSAILTRATGTSTWQFAEEALARPLGFTLARWPQDAQGVYFGGNDMLMTPRQMLAFGELYRNRGAVSGRQIVPASWIAASFVPRGRSDWSDQQYGYGWWMRELAAHQAYYAWGYGGQYIFVVLDLDLVIVTTSSVTAGEERRSHRRTVLDLVERFVIEPLAAGGR